MLAVITVLNAAIAAFYYLRVVVYMYMREPKTEAAPLRHGRLLWAGLAVTTVLDDRARAVPGAGLRRGGRGRAGAASDRGHPGVELTRGSRARKTAAPSGRLAFDACPTPRRRSSTSCSARRRAPVRRLEPRPRHVRGRRSAPPGERRSTTASACRSTRPALDGVARLGRPRDGPRRAGALRADHLGRGRARPTATGSPRPNCGGAIARSGRSRRASRPVARRVRELLDETAARPGPAARLRRPAARRLRAPSTRPSRTRSCGSSSTRCTRCRTARTSTARCSTRGAMATGPPTGRSPTPPSRRRRAWSGRSFLLQDYHLYLAAAPDP